MSMISHILIVDDDTALLEALPETIRSRMANVSVDIADSGRKALALIADVDYDAIVTDIKMPELDGLGLLERVRDLRPDTPTLLITGHGERDLAIRAIRGGAYDFIEKPIDRDHFIASLCRAVQARRLRRQVDDQSQALARHADELEQMVQERTRELVEANGAKDEFLSARDHALAVAERAQERLAFLAEATRILVTSLDPTDTLSRLARFLVPTLADYCVINLTVRGGVSRRVAMMHAHPECMDTLHNLADRIAPDEVSAGHAIVKTQEADRAVWYHDLAHAGTTVDRAYFEAHQALGAESIVIAPLAAHGRSLGVMTLARIRSGAGYRQEDVDLAEELARRAALAVANARLYSDAQDANRLKDEFLATVSHELRTPLTAMLGWAQMLQGGTLDEATARRAIASIERNAKFQAHLIEDLLDISRISTGKLRLDTRPVELAQIIEASLDSVRPAADAKNIRLRRVLDWKAGLVSGDPDRLQQVVWNLLSNAIKFTPRGGLVEVALQRKDSQVQVAVTDNGQGISPEFLPYMFDLFRQADSSITRSHGGLGLGLAIVKHLVEMHGGTVQATSPGDGQGATFAVTFPLAGVGMSDEGGIDGDLIRAGNRAAELSQAPELTGLSVLVVDDEPETRELLIEVLSKCGADVRACSSADDALETLKHWKADVLISDIGMPGEDGYELIRKVRAMDPEQGGRIPAVALTAYARGEDRLRALSAGFQMHVAKPVEPAELAAVVASFAWQAGKGRGHQPV
jgi:signal transduction histidine kinase/DNA-binding response OmpR family regulator